MNTREVAEKLDTDPKRLRRFLRADPTYRNAGQGGHYEFTDKDLPTLRKRFDAWLAKTVTKTAAASSKSSKTSRRRKTKAKEIPPMPVDIATKRRLTPKEREERDLRSRQRVDRLEERLKAAGLHISQSRS